jgi:hypothetical protein
LWFLFFFYFRHQCSSWYNKTSNNIPCCKAAYWYWEKRQLATPSADIIKSNLLALKVKSSELFPARTANKINSVINNQLKHAECLAIIPHNGSTNCCESFHRLMKQNLRSISKGFARLYGFAYLEAIRRWITPKKWGQHLPNAENNKNHEFRQRVLQCSIKWTRVYWNFCHRNATQNKTILLITHIGYNYVFKT